MESIFAREPVLMTTFLAFKVRLSPLGEVSSIVFRPRKTPEAHEQFSPAVLEFSEMHVHQSLHHLAFAFTHGAHVDPAIVLVDAELRAPEKIRGHLGTVDDIFAGQTGDVGAGTADVLAFDDRRFFTRLGLGPGDEFTAFTTAQHKQIVFPGICDFITHVFLLCSYDTPPVESQKNFHPFHQRAIGEPETIHTPKIRRLEAGKTFFMKPNLPDPSALFRIDRIWTFARKIVSVQRTYRAGVSLTDCL